MIDLNIALNLVSVAIGFIAGLCFCIGAATTRPKQIALMAQTIAGANPKFLHSLISQRSQYIVGALYLIVSFFLQALGVLIPKGIQLPLSLFFQSPLVLFLIVLLCLSVIAWLVVVRITKATEREVMEIQRLQGEKFE